MSNLYITDLNVIKLYCLYFYNLILYKDSKGMASKKKKAEIKKKIALEHKHRMKRKDVRRCVSKRAMTPEFTCAMRIWIFLTWENKWYLYRGSSLQHSFHPKLDHSTTTPGEKDLQNNDLKLLSCNDYFVSFYIIATGIYSICVLLFQVNVLYDANVPPSTLSKIMSTLREDDKGTFLPKNIFNITEKSKGLLNMANGILQSMTKAEKVIQNLTT